MSTFASDRRSLAVAIISSTLAACGSDSGTRDVGGGGAPNGGVDDGGAPGSGGAVEPGGSAGSGGTARPTTGGASGSGGGSASGSGGSGASGSGSGGASGSGSGGASGGGSGGASGSAGGVTMVDRGAHIAAFQAGACALDGAGKLVCWGALPPSMTTIASPADSFAAITGAFAQVCALTPGGDASCYGLPGTDVPSMFPPGPFKSITSGKAYACGVIPAGFVECTSGTAPVAPTGVVLTQIAAGADFACGIRRDDHTVACFGNAGGDYSTCVIAPKEGQLEPPSGAFTQIAVGLGHACAIAIDGTLACWGAGHAGSMPTLDACKVRFNYDQAVPPPGKFKWIAAGIVTSCGVAMDGTVKCWGGGTTQGDCQNDPGACGQAVAPAGEFTEVAVGYTHACALRGDGKVVCWGSNTGGRATPPAVFSP